MCLAIIACLHAASVYKCHLAPGSLQQLLSEASARSTNLTDQIQSLTQQLTESDSRHSELTQQLEELKKKHAWLDSEHELLQSQQASRADDSTPGSPARKAKAAAEELNELR